MVKIKPFQGLLFNKDKVDVQQVVTEPYDKISAALNEEYHARSPYNVVRLIKGNDEDGDSDGNNKYTRAAHLMKSWEAEEVLVKPKKLSYYAYYQEYDVEGERRVRKGLVALVKLEDFASGNIRPHEKTLSKPKADRLNLLRATNTHFGHIFMLYSDIEKKLNTVMSEVVVAFPPLFDVKDEYGCFHKFWEIRDEVTVEIITELMADKELLIADGHHRYETACNFSKENDAWGSEEDPFNYQMMTLVNMEDEGLTVLPTHRMLHSIDLDSADRLLKLDKYFAVTKYSTYEELHAEQVKAEEKKPRFGLYLDKVFYLLEIKDIQAMDTDIEVDHSSDWKHLDVSILHALILEKLLGITLEKQAEQSNITYMRSAHEAIESVNSGQEQLGFFLNPTDVHQVAKLAKNGETMPQKSTDFFPKLLTGLVFQRIEK